MSAPSFEIVVISLTRAEARRALMGPMLDALGVAWRYFDAHTGLDNPRLSYDPQRAKTSFSRNLSPPEVAVYSSHYTAIQEFHERAEADWLVVLEDDILIDPAFPLGEFVALCAKEKLDYVRLFSRNFAPAEWLSYFYDRSIVRFKTSPAGTQAYLVSRAAAASFVENIAVVDATIDIAMDRFWKTGLPLYSIFPYPLVERFSPTSIPMQAWNLSFSPIEKALLLQRRVIDKLGKILGNRSLRAQDKAMRARSPGFTQITAR